MAVDSMRKSDDWDRGGFSLVELAVSCMLVGLFAVVSVKSVQGFLPAARVSRAVREVAALLDWARWSAVRQGRVFTVTVRPGEGLVRVFRQARDDAGAMTTVEVKRLDLAESHPGVVFGTADGVLRTSGCQSVDPSGVHLQNGTLRFLPSGTTDRCGSLYLIPEQDVPDRADRMRALSILLATGRLQTWAYNPLAPSECTDDGAWRPL